MTKRFFTITLIAAIIFTACITNQKSAEKTIYIGPELQSCMAGVAEILCMQVKWTKEQEEWEYFYGNIEGFNYEPGYEYELTVKEEKIKNPPAGGSQLKYILTEEISKTKVEIFTDEKLKKPFTSTHIFVAQFEGINYRICNGMTTLCPDKCGNSGEIATFRVIDYKYFMVNGEGGTQKLENYQVFISDYHRNDLDMPFVSKIRNLNEGDFVTIHLEYVYDTTLQNIYTVENLISLENILPTGDNSRTSLDWDGTYEGTLPCSDCDSIKTIITLNSNNTFSKTDIQIKNGKQKKTGDKGTFRWNLEGNSITLITKNDTLKYQVGENHLRQLDKSGKRIEGKNAEMYVLHKKQ